jgi:hypothetical protein
MEATTSTPFSTVPDLKFAGANPYASDVIIQVGQNSMEDSHHKLLHRIISPIFQFIGTVGAGGTLVVSIISLVFIMKDSNSKAPFIATLVVAAVSAFFVFAKELYDLRKAERNEKAAIKRQDEQKNLENARHQEVSELLAKTIDILEHHYEKPKENFTKSLKSIRGLPQRSKEDAVARDLLLSKILEESTEKNLKNTKNIENLAVKVENRKKALPPVPTNKKANTKDSSESTPGLSNQAELNFLKDYDEYEKEWKKIEEEAGFEINFLRINGIIYRKNGSIIKPESSPELRVSLS